MCYFPLYSKVNNLYLDIEPLLFGFPSHLGHHRVLSRVPCAVEQVLIAYLFYSRVCTSVPIFQFVPPPPSPFSIHRFVLYIRVSISALQISSSVSFFYTPHILAILYDICFSLTNSL